MEPYRSCWLAGQGPGARPCIIACRIPSNFPGCAIRYSCGSRVRRALFRLRKIHRVPVVTAPYTVELAIEKGTAITRSAIENHRRSREFVRKVFGV